MKRYKFAAPGSALLASALTSTLAQAHPGHGLEGVAHDLVHLVWLLNGLALFVVALVFVAGRTRRKP